MILCCAKNCKKDWPIWLVLGLTIIASLLFYFMPQIDLYFAHALHISGKEFLFSNKWLAAFFHKNVEKMQTWFYLALIPVWLLGLLRKKPVLGLTSRIFAFIAATVLLSTVLVVNLTLKDNWGRARPVDTIEVVGAELGQETQLAHFTPAWVMASDGLCRKNCSFPSGHASLAFSLIVFALLARRQKALWVSLVMIFGTVAGFMRMALGAHYLSDVFLGGAITILIALIMHKLIIKNEENLIDNKE